MATTMVAGGRGNVAYDPIQIASDTATRWDDEAPAAHFATGAG